MSPGVLRMIKARELICDTSLLKPSNRLLDKSWTLDSPACRCRLPMREFEVSMVTATESDLDKEVMYKR